MILRRMDSDKTGLSFAVGNFVVSSSVTCCQILGKCV